MTECSIIDCVNVAVVSEVLDCGCQMDYCNYHSAVSILERRVDRAMEIIRQLNYFRPGFMAKEYDIGSPSVTKLFDDARSFIEEEGRG